MTSLIWFFKLNMVPVCIVNNDLEEVSKLSFLPDVGNLSMSEY